MLHVPRILLICCKLIALVVRMDSSIMVTVYPGVLLVIMELKLLHIEELSPNLLVQVIYLNELYILACNSGCEECIGSSSN